MKNLKFNNLIILAIIGIFISLPSFVLAGSLSCRVASSCSGSEVDILEMANTTNSHASLPTNTYINKVCCSGVSSLGNSCSGNFKVVAKLSGPSNAHARINSLPDYTGSNNVCISGPSNATISIGYQANNCNGFDTTLFSMNKADTNSHIADATGPSSYANKVCASINVPIFSGGGGGGGPPPVYQCSDGIDNDSDGLIDMNDSGCLNISDNDEYNVIVSPPPTQNPPPPVEPIKEVLGENKPNSGGFFPFFSRVDESEVPSVTIPVLNEKINQKETINIPEGLNITQEISPTQSTATAILARVNTPIGWSILGVLVGIILLGLRRVILRFSK